MEKAQGISTTRQTGSVDFRKYFNAKLIPPLISLVYTPCPVILPCGLSRNGRHRDFSLKASLPNNNILTGYSGSMPSSETTSLRESNKTLFSSERPLAYNIYKCPSGKGAIARRHRVSASRLMALKKTLREVDRERQREKERERKRPGAGARTHARA